MSRWRTTKQKVNKPSSKSTNLAVTATPLKLRLKAAMVDLFMISMPICYGIIYGIMGGGHGYEAHRMEGWSYILILHATIIITFWKLKGQTPGMKAYEITLVKHHSTPPLPSLIIRFGIILLSFALFILFLLPFLRKDKAFLHDITSGTYPVYQPENQ